MAGLFFTFKYFFFSPPETFITSISKAKGRFKFFLSMNYLLVPQKYALNENSIAFQLGTDNTKGYKGGSEIVLNEALTDFNEHAHMSEERKPWEASDRKEKQIKEAEN